MAREWKPGDVAYSGGIIGFRTEKGWAYRDGSEGGLHQDHYDTARPLVVIDPEDDGAAMDALWSVLVNADLLDVTASRPRLQAALRELADPTPPKPPRPSVVGAVVEATYADNGKGAGPCLWVLNGEGSWTCITDGLVGMDAEWPYLTAVRVLSEGVTP